MVSIIVVSYNTREMTLECLRSIVRETPDLAYEVLFIDNQSTDGSWEAVEAEFSGDARFVLRSSEQNLGFAGANNEMAKDARGEFVLLLNPDTVVLDRAIEKLVAFARKYPDNGIWGGRTVFEDGSLNATSCWGPYSLWALTTEVTGLRRLFCGSAFFNPRGYPGWDRRGIREVGVVTGCWFLITRSLWEELDGFDPEFFMYGEETDLCMRAERLGARPIVDGAAEIVHYSGASERSESDRLVKMLDAHVRLFRRHWSRPAVTTAMALLDLKVVSRAMGERILRSNGKRSAWATVWRRRSEWRRGLAESGTARC